VRYTRESACLGIWLAALAACGAQSPQTGKPDAPKPVDRVELLKTLAGIAARANQAAPADIDVNTRLDGAKAGPGLRLTTTYTLVNSESEGVNSTTFAAKITPVVKEGSCKNPELRPLVDQGVVVVLEYRGNAGNPIGTISIDRDTCEAIR